MTAKVKLYRYLKISIPQKMLVNQILIFQVVLILTKNYYTANQSSVTSDVKKSKESKLVSYEIRFRDFYFSSVENGWLCKICCSFSHGNVGNRTFVDKPGKIGEHPLAMFSDHLNSNQDKLSLKNKQCFKEMSNRNV